MMYRGQDDGISWDHDDYTPHITITYDGGALDLMQIEPYTGPIELGPEIFEEIEGDYLLGLSEETLDATPQPPAHVAPASHIINVNVPPQPMKKVKKPKIKDAKPKVVKTFARDAEGRVTAILENGVITKRVEHDDDGRIKSITEEE